MADDNTEQQDIYKFIDNRRTQIQERVANVEPFPESESLSFELSGSERTVFNVLHREVINLGLHMTQTEAVNLALFEHLLMRLEALEKKLDNKT